MQKQFSSKLSKQHDFIGITFTWMYPNINQFTLNSLLTEINSIKINSIKLNSFHRITKHTKSRHLLLSCTCFGSLWPLVQFWIGFDGVDHQDILDHFIQFNNYTGGLKLRRSFLLLVWLLTVWVLWNKRNNRLFKQKDCSIGQLLDKLKSHSLWWLKANN